MLDDLYEFAPFFDQTMPERPIVGMIASDDLSESYELDACGVFEVKDGGFLVVNVSGCSCWPDMGSTDQTYCEDRVGVHRVLGTKWSRLYTSCQNAGWQVRQ